LFYIKFNKNKFKINYLLTLKQFKNMKTKIYFIIIYKNPKQ